MQSAGGLHVGLKRLLSSLQVSNMAVNCAKLAALQIPYGAHCGVQSRSVALLALLALHMLYHARCLKHAMPCHLVWP
jgi:hypothetical protein